MSVVLVCGGRDFTNEGLLTQVLDEVSPQRIISGMARGADLMAYNYATRRGIPCDEYPADWNKYGKSAGYIRNKQMLEQGRPDLVVAFPGGKGTSMMVDIAKQAGVEVKEIRLDNAKRV